MAKIQEFLTQKGLVVAAPTAEEIIKRAEETKKLKILYGETYDLHGEPIDSLKHYFFVANLAKVLNDVGIESEPTILVANSAVCRNTPEEDHAEVMEHGKKRANLLKKVNSVYKTDLKTMFMSDYIDTAQFKEKVENVKKKCLNNPHLMAMLEKTVPSDKIEIERKKEFQYSFEEVATILDFDIKVGPPREKFYDEIANSIAKNLNFKGLLPVYLTPSYPLGLKFDFFLSNPEIEEYGVTAYKAGSKGLQNNRIIIGKTSKDDLKNLIEKTFISSNSSLPNPTLDLCIISEIAKQRIGNQTGKNDLYDNFYSGKINSNDLKKMAIENVYNFVLSKLADYDKNPSH